MASRVSVDDAKTLASWMHTEPDFILNQERHHFATYIQDVTKNALSCSVSIDEVNKQPRLGDAAYEEMRRRNREWVSGRQQGARQQQPPPRQEQPPPQDKRPWTEADDQALADALNQLALAIRRKDTKRAAELQEHIDDLSKRKAASAETASKEMVDEETYRL